MHSSISNSSTDDQILSVVKFIKQKHPNNPAMASFLARKLADSGFILNGNQEDFTADVASTGGPSSLSTLLSPLFLCAAGAKVPKLGVPGRPAGGIDCLIQIPGFQASLNMKKVEEILCTTGYAHFLANEEIAPLDARVFRVRQEHGAQNIPTLVAASLLAKKMAVGVQWAGLDVRVAPYGNFGRDWTEAESNARLFIESARMLSISAFPVLTDARYPYQPYIGRSEALVALDYLFKSSSSAWLEEHFRTCKSLALACVPTSARRAIEEVSRCDLRHYFDQNLISQGATPEAFDRLVESTNKLHVHELKAASDGFAHFPLEIIRDVLVAWQREGERSGIKFPDPVGLILHRRPGDWVNSGDLMATARVANGRESEVLSDLKGCICTLRQRIMGPSIEGVIINE